MFGPIFRDVLCLRLPELYLSPRLKLIQVHQVGSDYVEVETAIFHYRTSKFHSGFDVHPLLCIRCRWLKNSFFFYHNPSRRMDWKKNRMMFWTIPAFNFPPLILWGVDIIFTAPRSNFPKASRTLDRRKLLEGCFCRDLKPWKWSILPPARWLACLVWKENEVLFFPNSNSFGIFSHSKGFGAELLLDSLWLFGADPSWAAKRFRLKRFP